MIEWDRILQALTNASVLIGGIKILRHMNRMEMRLTLMWNEFKKRFKVDDGDDW